MDIKSIEVIDTNGSLMDESNKHITSAEAVSARFVETEGARVIEFSPDNVDFGVFAYSDGVTFKQVLQYNGTLSSNKKVFQQTLVDETFAPQEILAPTLMYNPGNVKAFDVETVDDIIVELDMHNGTSSMLNVLGFKSDDLVGGEKSYSAVSVHTYPTTIKRLPNVENNNVYLDGWYSYTFIGFNDVKFKQDVSKGTYYGSNGMVFKASTSGRIYLDQMGVYILPADMFASGGTISIEGADPEVSMDIDGDASWAELRIGLKTADSAWSNYSHAFVDSQILITDEIRDAMVKEALCVAGKTKTSTAMFHDWQAITVKRQAAFVLFQNELFKHAQKVIESSRGLCSNMLRKRC